MRIDQAGAIEGFIAPNQPQEGLSRHDGIRVAQKDLEQQIFGLRKRYLFSVFPNPAFAKMNGHIPGYLNE